MNYEKIKKRLRGSKTLGKKLVGNWYPPIFPLDIFPPHKSYVKHGFSGYADPERVKTRVLRKIYEGEKYQGGNEGGYQFPTNFLPRFFGPLSLFLIFS